MPDSYRVSVTRTAVKEISRLDTRVRQLVEERIMALARDPRPHDHRRGRSTPGSYRIDIGDYRVLYEIDDAARSVVVWRAMHRRDVYRNL